MMRKSDAAKQQHAQLATTIDAVLKSVATLTAAVVLNAQAQEASTQRLMAVMSAPKEIVTDDEGRPVGVQTRLDA